MKSIKPFIWLIFILSTVNSFGQDCSSPLLLCGDTELNTEESVMANPFNSGCLNVSNSAVYQFTTNNNTTNPAAFNPYEINAEIIITQCEEAGTPISLSAAIFEPVDQLDYCGALTEIAACVTDTDTLNINSGVLSPNTDYLLVIGFNSLGGAPVCNFNTVISGAPLTIDACCDANLPLGLSTNLTVTGATVVSGQENYVWQPAVSLDDFTSSTPEAAPSITTIYSAEALVGDCLVSDEVTVSINQAIDVLNTFTPNGDGVNDTWSINRIENFDSALITVFDRWGQEVYKTIGYATPWDGTNEGKKLPTGTYYYVIELNSLEVVSDPFVGFVVIIH